MEGFLKGFDRKLRTHILIALYARAWQRVWLEQLRSEEKRRPPVLRRERAQAKRNREAIHSAIESVDDAIHSLKNVGTHKPGVAFREVDLGLDHLRFVQKLLQYAAEDWQFLEDLLVALVHPKLRNKSEKSRNIDSAPMENRLPVKEFGVAKIKQMFIEWTERYLSTLVTRTGSRLSSLAIDRIIAGTFDAAFGEEVDLETIKTMRFRLNRKRNPLVQNQ